MRYLLPTILATITGKPRYMPAIEWASNCWTHNAFRLYESIFGREYGIRCESSLSVDRTGKATYRFFTPEARIAHIEGEIRALSRQLAFALVHIPKIVSTNGISLPLGYMFAMGYDTGTGTASTFGASPRSFSVTTSGSDRMMVFNTSSLNDPGAAVPTYNSISATFIAKGTYPGVGRTGTSASYLIAPATGANTASFTAGSNLMGLAASYTGVMQSSQPDATANTNAVSTDLTATVSVVNAGCWLFGFDSDSSSTVPADSTGFVRANSTDGAVIFDSNAVVATGSQSIIITKAGGAGWEIVGVSFRSAAEPSTGIIINTLRPSIFTPGRAR